jgi:hypothetical protein
MVSWPVPALLAGILWADGIQVVPAGSVVIRRILAGPWRVASVSTTNGVRFLGWWPPFSLTLVLTEQPAPDFGADVQRAAGGSRDCQLAQHTDPANRPENNRPADELWNVITRVDTTGKLLADGQLVQQLREIATHLRLLRYLGSCLVLALVIVVPLATRDFGAFGLVAAITGVFALAITCAGVTVAALNRLGVDHRAAVRFSIPLLWPFSAPNSAERVLAHAFQNSSTIQGAACLLGPDEFARWVRPMAYDILSGVDSQPSVGVSLSTSKLLSLVGSEVLGAVVTSRPDGLLLGSAYCPRCGREYDPDVRCCAECSNIALIHQAGKTELLHHESIASAPQ